MLCENCKKNEAVFYYHENINGSEKTYRLCRDCLDKMEKDGTLEITDMKMPPIGFGAFFEDGFFGDAFKSVDSLFGSFFKAASPELGGGAAVKKCPTCGATVNDISRLSKVGCPDCYSTFRRELEGAIGRLHGHTAHTGRAPKNIIGKKETKNRISTLEAEQKEAIRSENYEKAALIRDELKKLRENL